MRKIKLTTEDIARIANRIVEQSYDEYDDPYFKNIAKREESKTIVEQLDAEMNRVLRALNNMFEVIKGEYGFGSEESTKFNKVKNNIIYEELNPILKELTKRDDFF